MILPLLLFGGGAAEAADPGMDHLKKECASCHNLTGPAPATLQELWTRQGPDLFYAGNKYKPEWVESWLQKPTRIRPAGSYYGNHIKAGEKGDHVDETSLSPHPALSPASAKAVAAALMTLKAGSDRIRSGDYQPGTLSMSMGEMIFVKFRGCIACHEIESEYGGLSGPELYTAAKRLREDYMISFMRNPQAWNPKTFMPNKHLTETDLQKMVHYLRGLSGEEEK